MGAFFSKRHRRPSHVAHHRSFSIYPENWADKDYTEVVTFLKDKYPNAHVTMRAEKESTCDLTFTKPVSFEEDNTRIVVVYNCHNNRIMGFYESSN